MFVSGKSLKLETLQTFTWSRKEAPPTPYNPKCGENCQGKDLHGPYGWCHVELFEVSVYTSTYLQCPHSEEEDSVVTICGFDDAFHDLRV